MHSALAIRVLWLTLWRDKAIARGDALCKTKKKFKKKDAVTSKKLQTPSYFGSTLLTVLTQ